MFVGYFCGLVSLSLVFGGCAGLRVYGSEWFFIRAMLEFWDEQPAWRHDLGSIARLLCILSFCHVGLPFQPSEALTFRWKA